MESIVKFLLGTALLLSNNVVLGQLNETIYTIQFSVNLGSPVNNIGANIIAQYNEENIGEIALGYGITYNFDGYGPRTGHLEHRIQGSLHYLWGEKEYISKDLGYVKYLDSGRSGNSLGYTWERYFNRLGTTQNVGTIHFRVENVVFQFSNDVFANSNGKDRYRTGAFGLGYIEGPAYYNVKLLIWAGDSHCKGVKKNRNSDYPARWGYRDISDCNYGKLSHGILSFGMNYNIGQGQTLGARLGIDAEQIRNTIQNKVFHDLYFIPDFMNKTRNLHLPMKTVDGENYLFKEEQEVRPAKFVWQLSLNPSPLY